MRMGRNCGSVPSWCFSSSCRLSCPSARWWRFRPLGACGRLRCCLFWRARWPRFSPPPREWTPTHLTKSSPLSYVVAGCALASLLPRRLRAPLAMALSFVPCIMLWNGVSQRLHLESAQTRGGVLLGEPKDLALEHSLEASIQKGEPFFAFPYTPIAYFLTQGANPTRYSFLQPGMMADSDEDQALASLMSRATGQSVLHGCPRLGISASLSEQRSAPAADAQDRKMAARELRSRPAVRAEQSRLRSADPAATRVAVIVATGPVVDSRMRIVLKPVVVVPASGNLKKIAVERRAGAMVH